MSEISYTEGIEKLISGIDKITDAAQVTLGGAGNHVLIESKYGQDSNITKDGVSVIRSIYFDDPIENMGANFIKEVATKTLQEVGDGTTSSSIIARKLIVDSYNAIKEGHRPLDIRKGINKAKDDIIKQLATLSRKIENSSETRSIATISANNDEKLGDIISEAFGISGIDGLITVQRSLNNQNYLEEAKGYYLDSGLYNNHFAKNIEKLTSEYVNPYILIYDKIIDNFYEIRAFTDWVVKSETNRPIIIFCEECKKEVIGLCINWKMQNILDISIVTIPGSDKEDRQGYIDDISNITGAKCFNTPSELSGFEGSDIGTCEKVIMTKMQTTIVNGREKNNIKEYKELVKKSYHQEENKFRKEQLRKRLSSLNANSVTIYVGGISETEMKEREDRIDDAIHATRAALIEGYVPGGGTTLAYISQEMPSSEDKGYSILMSAIQEPYKKILENAGVKHETSIKIGKGYNVVSEKAEDFYEKGIIDPTKVVRICVENAVAVAMTVLSTKAIITSSK